MLRILIAVLLICITLPVLAAEPIKPIPRRIPPKGIKLPGNVTKKLEADLAKLEKRIAGVDHKDVVDAAVLAKAVGWALMHGEFYKKGDEKKAQWAIDLANKRLDALAEGKKPWGSQRGLVVRGYRSDIDGSVQPYGLEIPEKLDLNKPVPLYVWLHGRGDKVTDLHFLHQRAHKKGKMVPDNAIVLHPFGRHCMGFKSAGEIDVLDVIADVEKRYKIDSDRIVLAGFSMGGAGAWHIGAHYTDRFCAVHAGAGFVDVKRYQNVDPSTVPEAEVKLWGLYDVPGYVRNLFNVPVIAYSGEKDKQKAAADIMAEAYAEHGKELPHVIGKGMGHKYDEKSLKEVMKFLDEAVKKGRPSYSRPSLQTRTLRYGKLDWVEVLGLKSHWLDARIDGRLGSHGTYSLVTKNISAVRIPAGDVGEVAIDGSNLEFPESQTHNSLIFIRRGDSWVYTENIDSPAKRPGLQGPIDDAFMEPFLVVTPSGKSSDARVQRWVDFELKHFLDRWRGLYRGEARVKVDTLVTEEDIAKYHLILWGTPESNKLINRVTGDLPVGWRDGKVALGEKRFDGSTHVPLSIYPNPLNRHRYVVLNSGPTHRESHDRTNSLQNPKLGDWAIIDIRQDPDGETPGKVVTNGFFGEQWELKAGSSR